MNSWPEQIKKALQTELPGAVSHKKMVPPGRKLVVAPEDKPGLKYSSVLLALFEDNSELTGCLIKRPAHMKHHAGQIAMPGGRIEKNEKPEETALRETFEEIGILPETIEIIGTLSDLYVEVSQFIIHPLVGWLKEKPVFSINKNEVERIVLFPLLKFKNKTSEVEVETIYGKLNVPCIRFENEIIWGATAMILSEFYDVFDDQSFAEKSA